MPVSDAPFRPLWPVGSNEAEGRANPQCAVDRTGWYEREGVSSGTWQAPLQPGPGGVIMHPTGRDA